MDLPQTSDTLAIFKNKALQWAAGFDVAVCLNSNQFADKYSKFDLLIAAGVRDELIGESPDAFKSLESFTARRKDWLLGFLSYDLKNETELLHSANPDLLQFPGLYFFAPKHLLIFKGDHLEVISNQKQEILTAIASQPIANQHINASGAIKTRFSKAEYIESVKAIQQNIIRGDIYEATFCQEFYAVNATIDPLSVYRKLTAQSPSPFGAFFKFNNQYILSASPERFLAKRGQKLISQPIKGTSRRGKDKIEDEQLKSALKNNPKEQQENVMIVDLVRNDLTRSARPGTVKVEELFGIYSFEQVHQMISTIVCEKDERLSDIDSIKNSFPMGSMTGAPKISAMQLMEKHERSKRGIYSGSVGYFSPDGDFDFNVVIRTVLYNAANRYLSFQAGSAITANAVAEKEYEECLLKVGAIMKVLGDI